MNKASADLYMATGLNPNDPILQEDMDEDDDDDDEYDDDDGDIDTVEAESNVKGSVDINHSVPRYSVQLYTRRTSWQKASPVLTVLLCAAAHVLHIVGNLVASGFR